MLLHILGVKVNTAIMKSLSRVFLGGEMEVVGVASNKRGGH